MTLSDLIDRHRNELLGLWRTQVRHLPSAGELDTPTLTDSMPDILSGLTRALRTGDEVPLVDIFDSSPGVIHGLDRLAHEFSIAEVLAEYAAMQELIFDLAHRSRVELTGRPTHIITRYFAKSMTTAAEVYVGRGGSHSRAATSGHGG